MLSLKGFLKGLDGSIPTLNPPRHIYINNLPRQMHCSFSFCLPLSNFHKHSKA